MNVQAMNVTNVTIRVVKKDFSGGTWYNIWKKTSFNATSVVRNISIIIP